LLETIIFKTESDVKVILAIVIKKKEWTSWMKIEWYLWFAIYDAEKMMSNFIARDHMGIIPLY